MYCRSQGRARFQYYQKLAAFVFAIVQGLGQLTYIRWVLLLCQLHATACNCDT